MSAAFESLAAQVPGSTPALMQWLSAQLAAGHTPASLRSVLHDKGWSPQVAAAALAACGAVPPDSAAAAPPMPWPNLEGLPSSIDVGDRQVQVLLSLHTPRLVLFANLLSEAECAQLRADALPAMARSHVVATRSSVHSPGQVSPERTSQGMFYTRGQTPVVARLEARIAQLLHWPIENGEGLQVLHYLPGAQYRPHHDYFDPQDPGSATLLQRGGQRVGTLIIYLNDVPAGGCTLFPETALRIHPRQGHAVFFAYPHATAHSLSLHAGEPVLTGEKWIATKWLREREFR